MLLERSCKVKPRHITFQAASYCRADFLISVFTGNLTEIIGVSKQ
jgi:hypothetical protein